MKTVIKKTRKRTTNSSSKQAFPLLVLIISGKKCTIYQGTGDSYHKVPHGPESIEEVINDSPSRVANFTDSTTRRQVMINKFLKRIDGWLETLINSSPLPVFLLAPEKVAGHFKKITRHRKSIAGYIHGNFDDITIPQLRQLLQPFVNRMIFTSDK